MSLSTTSQTLPPTVRRFFWDVPADAVVWPRWRDFIIGRVLRVGDGAAVTWLRTQLSNEELAHWLRAHQGGRLSPRRLRYWQLMLDLPAAEVDPWVAEARAGIWDARARA